MSATISDGVTALTPRLLSGYRHARKSANVLHEIPGSAALVPTLRPALLRRGTLLAVVDTMAEAFALDALLAAADTFTLTVAGAASLGMTFVVDENGDVVVELDPVTGAVWTVSVDFQEVL